MAFNHPHKSSDFLSTLGAGAGIGAIGLLGCLGILLFIAFIIALNALFWGGIIYLVWNFAIAAAFTVPTLTYFWQSVAIGLAFSLIMRALKGTLKGARK